jgi:hypothetical protein
VEILFAARNIGGHIANCIEAIDLYPPFFFPHHRILYGNGEE